MAILLPTSEYRHGLDEFFAGHSLPTPGLK